MSCILSSVPVMLMSNFRTNVLEAVQVFGFPFFVIFVNWLSFRLHNLFMKSCLLTLAHLMASRISQLLRISLLANSIPQNLIVASYSSHFRS
jgi:hypothetical protein